jgi:hypothetical protein
VVVGLVCLDFLVLIVAVVSRATNRIKRLSVVADVSAVCVVFLV